MKVHLRPAYLPSYRPSFSARYSPPPPFSNAVLGQSSAALNHIKDQLPQSLVIGVLGATGVYAGDILPSPANIVVKVAGVSAFAFAIYQLFGSPPPAQAPGKNKVDPGTGVPNTPLPYKPDELQVELDAQQLGRGGLQRGAFSTSLPTWLGGAGGYQGFDFMIRNNTDKEIQLFAGLKITDSDGNLLWRSYPSTNQPYFGRRLLVIPTDPTGTKNFIRWTLWIDTVFWFRETFVQVELFRGAEDLDSFKVSYPLEVIWGPVA